VQSALGEPLRAEVDLLDLTAEESASLRTRIAPPDVFKTAGLDFNAGLLGARVALAKRPDGRPYLQIVGDKGVNEPYLDLILEASWASGRITRDYTLLFDPPSLKTAPVVPAATATESVAPQLAPPGTSAEAAVPAPQAPSPSPAPASALARPVKPAVPAQPANKGVAPPAAKAAQRAPVAAKPASSVTVQAGDTAGKIAAQHKPAAVSLDQMLVAMLRSNPQAFIGDNINRIKAGAVVALPGAEQAGAVDAQEAKQLIGAQSQDFNAYRRNFAAAAPRVDVATPKRSASGKVQALVDEKKPTASAADKLTLSKGAVAAAKDDQLARERAAQDAANRVKELSKNISDLNKLASQASAPAAAPAMQASASKPPALPAPVAVPVSAPLSAPAAAAPAVSAPAASAPAAAASAVASTAPAQAASAPASKPKAAPPPPPEPAPEPGLLDDLLENPLLPAAAAGLLALLGGLAFVKLRQRKKGPYVDSGFAESGLNPESFFGASGGQNVNTSDNPATGSSMIYSPSQLDAVDDVDPVAEADVYLAYGRDLQAEEILKDALRSAPDRLAIHQKLLEIYAKRRDAKSFESIATLAFNLTNGTGPAWEAICAMGLGIDPDNALYLPGGQPLTTTVPVAPAAKTDADSPPPVVEPELDTGAIDLDLDLDFSLDDQPTTPTAPMGLQAELTQPMATQKFPAQPSLDLPTLALPAAAPEPAPEPAPAAMASLDLPALDLDPPALDAGLDWDMEPSPVAAAEPIAPAPPAENLLADTLSFDVPSPPVVAPPSPPAANPADLLQFDLGDLSLDLADDEPVTESPSLAGESDDPLETKLALAEEFRAIGDDDGARALIEEVIAEAGGETKARAQRALSKL
jgi:pilus assembly protein FimV